MNRIKTYAQFQSISLNKSAVVIAKTQGCSVCMPVTLRLSELMENYPTLPLYELYIEDVPEFRGQHLVFTVPTIIILKNQSELHRESRFIDWDRLTLAIESIL